MGLEPTTTGITILDSTNWATATIETKRVKQNVSNEVLKPQTDLVCPTGIEPVTPSLEGWCSIRLSYGQMSYTFDKNLI